MRVVVQRVTHASVVINGAEVGSCGNGFLLLVGIGESDSEIEISKMASKVTKLRIFNDEDGKMNLALDPGRNEREGNHILAVSNFTLYGNVSKSNRPSFSQAGKFDRSQELFESFVAELRRLGLRVATGVFGGDMQISLVNDGPVTLILDSLELS